MQKNLFNWTTAKQSIWWRYIDDVFVIWNHGQIYHTHFSNNQQVTPHHQVHRRMAHRPSDIPEHNHGDPIQNKYVPKTTHTRKCLCPDSCHQPGFRTEDLEVMGTEKHTRTITCHADKNRKATGPLN